MRFYGFLLVLLASPAGLRSQPDTVLLLDEVVVRSFRLSDSLPARRQEAFDLQRTELLVEDNLAELLAANSQLYLKNYGPGRLATPSLRGASASQTAIVWNGLNLQSPFLGQVDLSLLPPSLIDGAGLRYGSESALWGSGAVGGSLYLNTETPESRSGGSGRLQLGHGSFGRWRTAARLNYGAQHWSASVRAFGQLAENDFPYQRINGAEARLPNAQLRQGGLLTAFSARLSAHDQLTWQLWRQYSVRHIPPTTLSARSAAVQEDDWWRSTVAWRREGDRADWRGRAAWFSEGIRYRDTIAGIDSDSRGATWIGELENRQKLGRHRLRWGVNHTWMRAEATDYASVVTQHRTALMAGFDYYGRGRAWSAGLQFRQELVDEDWAPLTLGLTFNTQLHPDWRVYGNLSRSYRLPTFNDLYWNPGGNPELQAENGWNSEAGLAWSTTAAGQHWSAKVGAFSLSVDDWIQWIPQGSFWSPRNVQRVWSRGLESSFRTRQRLSESFSWQIEGAADYVRTTKRSSRVAGDQTVGLQLIYVPQWRLRGGLKLQWGSWSMRYTHTYTGPVFTVADHSRRLPGFTVGDLQVGKTMSWSAVEMTALARVRNLTDADYQSVAFQPMPGRHFQLSIFLQFNAINNQ